MTAPAARRRQRPEVEANRRRLLEAAGAVFAERGVSAGVEEVARAAGVGVGTLYRRFPTKDALIDALAAQVLPRLSEDARAALDAPDGQGFERHLVAMGEILVRYRGSLGRVWPGDAPRPDEEYWQLINRLILDAKAAGRIREDVTRADVSLVFWSLRGVLATDSPIPQAWRRQIAVLVAGFRPSTERLPAVDQAGA